MDKRRRSNSADPYNLNNYCKTQSCDTDASAETSAGRDERDVKHDPRDLSLEITAALAMLSFMLWVMGMMISLLSYANGWLTIGDVVMLFVGSLFGLSTFIGNLISSIFEEEFL